MLPFVLHGHAGPNPYKVALLLAELSLPYTTKIWSTEDLKKPPFTTQVNPNGYSPALEDPNTGLTLWESGAIMLYILEKYDTANTLSFPASAIKERALTYQYMFFQATFQGPQLSALLYYTHTANAAARKRHLDESLHVLDVLETELRGKEYLVGNKCSAADLAFVPYMWSHAFILGDEAPDLARDLPGVHAWYERLSAREAVRKVRGVRDSVLAQHFASLKK